MPPARPLDAVLGEDDVDLGRRGEVLPCLGNAVERGLGASPTRRGWGARQEPSLAPSVSGPRETHWLDSGSLSHRARAQLPEPPRSPHRNHTLDESGRTRAAPTGAQGMSGAAEAPAAPSH